MCVSNMPVNTLDYAPVPTPRWRTDYNRLRRLVGALVRATARWCWNRRQRLSGVAAALIAGRVVWLSFGARVVLHSSRDSGSRGAARGDLAYAGMMFPLILILWWYGRSDRLASRLSRTCFVIAAAWWVCVRYQIYGWKPPWYW